jgi:hypothetical protein
VRNNGYVKREKVSHYNTFANIDARRGRAERILENEVGLCADVRAACSSPVIKGIATERIDSVDV